LVPEGGQSRTSEATRVVWQLFIAIHQVAAEKLSANSCSHCGV